MEKNPKFSHRNLSAKLKNIISNIVSGKVYLLDDNLRRDFTGARVMFTSGTLEGLDYTILSTLIDGTLHRSGRPLTLITLDGIDVSKLTIGDKLYVYWDLTLLSPDEFNNTEIMGAAFDVTGEFGVVIPKVVFPAITGVLFSRQCILDNIIIPPGNIVDDSCWTREIQMQNDRLFWERDKVTKLPVRCMAEGRLGELGLSANPNDISNVLLDESVITTEEKRLKLEA